MSKQVITVVLALTSVGWYIDIKIDRPSVVAPPRVATEQALLSSSPSLAWIDYPCRATLHYGGKCYA